MTSQLACGWRASGVSRALHFQLGVPRLILQVARSSLFQPWRATPSSSSGTPLAFLTSLCLWKLVLACHAQGIACHALALCLARLLWKVELAWHAQGLACHAPFVSEWFLCLACHATNSSGTPQCFSALWMTLACHAWGSSGMPKWRKVSGVPRLRYQVARPCNLPPSSFLETCTSVPRLKAGVPRPWSCLGSSSWRATPQPSSGTP